MISKIVGTAKTLRWNWDGWFMGIFGAIISGFAAILGSGFGASVADPENINFGQGLHKLILVVVVSGGISSVTSLGKYLYAHPTPDPITEEENESK